MVLALTIKIKKKGFTPNSVTLAPLLLPFKEVKDLNAKMLYSLFLFRSKVPKTKGEDLESDKSTSLEDALAASSLQKRKARKVFKRYFKKKLKTGPAESLAFNRANRKKGKVAIIAEADKKVIIRKLRPKQKKKCSCCFKTLAKLIETLDSKKEPENGVLSIL